MLFADCNYDTRADKLSVALAYPFLRSRIVVEQFVKLLTRLHFIEPFLLAPLFLRARGNSSVAFVARGMRSAGKSSCGTRIRPTL